MATDEHTESVAQRFGWPAAITALATTVGVLVTLVLGEAVKQHAFWIIVAIACLTVLIAWLIAASRAGAAARRRIGKLEQQAAAQREEREHRAAAQREELDRLQLIMARASRAALPAWLLVAIEHTERSGGRIDLDPQGLRFVSASRDGTWTVTLPVSADPAAQARDHDGLHRALDIGQAQYTTALIQSSR
jgi:hypothetical protein